MIGSDVVRVAVDSPGVVDRGGDAAVSPTRLSCTEVAEIPPAVTTSGGGGTGVGDGVGTGVAVGAGVERLSALGSG